MKAFLERLDWEAIRPASIETAREECDSRESQPHLHPKMTRSINWE
jgi:hypothetical protein